MTRSEIIYQFFLFFSSNIYRDKILPVLLQCHLFSVNKQTKKTWFFFCGLVAADHVLSDCKSPSDALIKGLNPLLATYFRQWSTFCTCCVHRCLLRWINVSKHWKIKVQGCFQKCTYRLALIAAEHQQKSHFNYREKAFLSWPFFTCLFTFS